MADSQLTDAPGRQSARKKVLWQIAKTQALAPGTPAINPLTGIGVNGTLPAINSPTDAGTRHRKTSKKRHNQWRTTEVKGAPTVDTIDTGKNRPVLPQYDADLPLFRALFSWNGTILPLVFRRSAFWILWGSHGVLVALYKLDFPVQWHTSTYEEDHGSIYPAWAAISVPTSLMVFFLATNAA